MVRFRKCSIIVMLLALAGCTGKHLVLDGKCITCLNPGQSEAVVDVKEETVVKSLGATGKVIDSMNFYYFYASVSKEGIGVKKLAAMYYDQYRHTRNELEAERVLESIKADIQNKLDVANSSSSIFVPVQATLGSYDTKKGGFNLNLSQSYSFDHRNYRWYLAFPGKVHNVVLMGKVERNSYLQKYPTRHVNILVESDMSAAKHGTLYANPRKLHVINPEGELLTTIIL